MTNICIYIYVLLSSACESSVQVDPEMPLLHSTVAQAARVWDKLSRYQHDCTFLKHCLDNNVIPAGFILNFNLALNVDDADLVKLCKQSLQRTSKELCVAVLQALQNRVNLLQRELQTCREQIFSSVNNGSANYIWNGLKAENSNLLQNLKEREKRKLLKTIPLDQEFLSNNTRDLPINTATQARRYCGLNRLVRKRKLFRRKRRLLNTTTSNVPHQLDPINLSNISISQDQINLLKKGPSFCPMPKDVDWQRIYDDLEAFEARLRTAVFFIEANPEDSQGPPSHLPQVPKEKKWKPPPSRYPELELFLSSVRRDLINPRNIKLARDNLTKGERVALKQLRNSDVVVRIQDKGSRFVLIEKGEYEDKMFGQLQNQLHYKPLQEDPTIRHLTVVESWCDKWVRKGEISNQVANWIVNKEAKPGVAFGNIKTHIK